MTYHSYLTMNQFNTFEILGRDGFPVDIQKLDSEVCRFWNVPSNPDFFASPKEDKSYFANWVTIIGTAISQQGTYLHGWANVVDTMISSRIGRCFIDKNNACKLIYDARVIHEIQKLFDFYQPYLALIDYFAERGYQPRQIQYTK